MFDNLTVSDNFLIGRERTWPRWLGPLGFLSAKDEQRQWREHAECVERQPCLARRTRSA